MFIFYILVGTLIGFLSGLFGIGGSIIGTPVLKVFFGISDLIALASPLPVTIPTAISGVYGHFRHGTVNKKLAAITIVGGLPATIIGAYCTKFTNSHWLMILTGIFVVLTGIRLLRDNIKKSTFFNKYLSIYSLAGLIGVVAGFFSGLLAIGGGKVDINLIDRYIKSYKQSEDKTQADITVDNQESKTGIINQFSTKLDQSVKNDYNQASKAVALVRPRVQFFVNRVNHYNQAVNSYTARQKDDDAKADLIVGSTGTIPFMRRLSGIWYAFLAHNYFKAAGKCAVLVNNIPEDTRDIKTAINELKGIKSEIPTSFQIPFSNFRGTFLNKPLKKMIESENETIKQIGKKIFKMDKTFDRTWIGKKFIKLIGSKSYITERTKKLDIYGVPIKAIKYEGSYPAEFTGKTFLRTPVLALYLFYTFELPTIYKTFKKSPKEGFKQIAKSFMSVNALIFGTAIGGATGSYKGSVTGLVGMSIGSYAGFKVSKWVNKQIDKI